MLRRPTKVVFISKNPLAPHQPPGYLPTYLAFHTQAAYDKEVACHNPTLCWTTPQNEHGEILGSPYGPCRRRAKIF